MASTSDSAMHCCVDVDSWLPSEYSECAMRYLELHHLKEVEAILTELDDSSSAVVQQACDSRASRHRRQEVVQGLSSGHFPFQIQNEKENKGREDKVRRSYAARLEPNRPWLGNPKLI